jgi:hypothetical protein
MNVHPPGADVGAKRAKLMRGSDRHNRFVPGHQTAQVRGEVFLHTRPHAWPPP